MTGKQTMTGHIIIYHYNYVKIDYEAISTLQMLPRIERLPLLDAEYCGGGGGGGESKLCYTLFHY